jgi:hypothetical protein
MHPDGVLYRYQERQVKQMLGEKEVKVMTEEDLYGLIRDVMFNSQYETMNFQIRDTAEKAVALAKERGFIATGGESTKCPNRLGDWVCDLDKDHAGECAFA